MLDSAFQQVVEDQLKQALGSYAQIESVTPVNGGDINESLCLSLAEGTRVFMKYNRSPLPNLFVREAEGLQLLAETNTLKIPKVIALSEGTGDHPAFLLLEWIESDQDADASAEREFGRQLAKLHQHKAVAYGLKNDNYIGSLPQSNQPQAKWIDFYREQRLDAQFSLLEKQQRLTQRRAHLINLLMDSLNRFIDEEAIQPSLLHGDLWGGNFLMSNGQAVLIDPAIYYGHREIEMAFTELFGGFSQEFYQGYHDVWALPSDYQERKSLYQLYPLLVHLSLFGESYGSRVDAVLEQYVGTG